MGGYRIVDHGLDARPFKICAQGVALRMPDDVQVPNMLSGIIGLRKHQLAPDQ